MVGRGPNQNAISREGSKTETSKEDIYASSVSFLLVPFVFASDLVHLSLSLSIYASWGLCWKEEVGCETGNCAQYCAAGDPCAAAGEDASCPCASGKTYHGRGPMQLSWNYNYEPAGRALGVDLLAEPERITQDLEKDLGIGPRQVDEDGNPIDDDDNKKNKKGKKNKKK